MKPVKLFILLFNITIISFISSSCSNNYNCYRVELTNNGDLISVNYIWAHDGNILLEMQYLKNKPGDMVIATIVSNSQADCITIGQ